jgi:hypothetical protein
LITSVFHSNNLPAQVSVSSPHRSDFCLVYLSTIRVCISCHYRYKRLIAIAVRFCLLLFVNDRFNGLINEVLFHPRLSVSRELTFVETAQSEDVSHKTRNLTDGKIPTARFHAHFFLTEIIRLSSFLATHLTELSEQYFKPSVASIGRPLSSRALLTRHSVKR